ncbi:YbhN family protein [Streptomyces polygonati]|uniref:YbhN family protein n=1 Tax=Streptomyces polygonati TaxID=1617087 RepID=A0ABV8HR67_9ACTN
MALLRVPLTTPFPRRLTLRRIACLVPITVVAVWMVRHWQVIASGGRGLLGANAYWLLVALTLTGVGLVTVSFTRQGAILEPLPAGKLFATQFAAGAANHLLPAGLGADAVNLRFLKGRGLPLATCTAALALYSVAQSTSRIVLLLTLLVVFPHALRLSGVLPHAPALLLLSAGGGLICTTVLAVIVVRRLRGTIGTFVGTALTNARSVHARPARAFALWGGALAYPALQATEFAVIALALDMPVASIHVAIAYLAGASAAAGVPSPGGLGTVDTALVVALMSAGSPVGIATSTVLGYRIITVWLPLLPAALMLGALVRRKVI